MTRRPQQVQIVWGHKLSQIEQKLDEIIPWVRQADRPFYDIFLLGIDAEITIGRWLQRHSSELSLQRTRLLIADDRIAGGYIAVAGSKLTGCRQADLLDLARQMGEHSYTELRARMDDLSTLFAPVEAHDFYLSKLGICPQMEGQNLEKHLLDDCLHRARQGGFGQVRVDVPEHNATSRAFYEAHGFQPIYRGKSRTSDVRYLSMTCSV